MSQLLTLLLAVCRIISDEVTRGDEIQCPNRWLSRLVCLSSLVISHIFVCLCFIFPMLIVRDLSLGRIRS